METPEDPLWFHFEPLWQELTLTGHGLLVAGGYGLFLKQRWLARETNPKIVVPLERWPDATPRVTRDLDMVVGLDLIADEEANGRMLGILARHGFKVTGRREGQRWQFNKDIGGNQHLVVELHAPSPAAGENRLATDRIRVKHKPSLGNDGVHARHNPEALGCGLSPFDFIFAGVRIVVPNPVTWTVMKLTAASDRWNRARQVGLNADERDFSRAQAIKHIHDACRAVAMMSPLERDTSFPVAGALKETEPFEKAVGIFIELFESKDAWGREILRGRWDSADLDLIIDMLGSWYRIPEVISPLKS